MPTSSDGFSDDAASMEAPASRAAEAAATTPVADRMFADAEGADADVRFTLDRTEGEESQATEAEEPSAQFQAGTLTAGSLNDFQNFDEFRSFFRRPANRPFVIGRRAMIHVLDSREQGVADARVTVRTVGGQQQPKVLLERTTGADGRLQLLAGLDGGEQAEELELVVVPPGGGEAITRKVDWEQSDWTVVLSETAGLPQQLDLALVIDTTGSMGDELEYLKVEIDNIAAAVKAKFPNVDQRFALILYRDQGDQYVTRTFDFSGSLSEFRQELSRQSASGGGDYPEAMHTALQQTTQLSWRARNTARVVFLVGDAPPHDHEVDAALAAVKTLRDKSVRVYPIAASGARDKAEYVMRVASFLTQGRYLFLTDHSGVGNAHAKPHAEQYNIEPLNQLMVRMIATELAGREVPARDLIGGNSLQPWDDPLEGAEHVGGVAGTSESALATSEENAGIGFARGWGLLVLLGLVMLVDRRCAV